MSQKQKLVLWLLITIILGALSGALISNYLELPIHDSARDVVRFGPGDVAYDAAGNRIDNWQANSWGDDLIKGAVLVAAAWSYWKFLATFITNNLLKGSIVVLTIIGLFIIVPLIDYLIYGLK